MRKLLSALLLCLVALPGLAQERQREIYRERSLYRDVVVYEENGLRCIRFGFFNSGPQTCMILDKPKQLAFPYSRMLLGALFLQPDPQRVLVIGLGGGSVASALREVLPKAEIDCVELDPAVIKVARSLFAFVPENFSTVAAEDGRVFVKRAQRQGRKYDIVILDAFDHVYIPEHMITREYFQEIRSILAPGGVVAANTFASSQLYDAESATYADVFGPFYQLTHLNRVLLLRKDGLPGMAEMTANAARLAPALAEVGVDAEWVLSLVKGDVRWPEGTRILTDQYAPANLLNGRR